VRNRGYGGDGRETGPASAFVQCEMNIRRIQCDRAGPGRHVFRLFTVWVQRSTREI